jgi:dTDP-4-dehydrorhamnose reductase
MEDWTPVGLSHAEIEVTDGPGVLDRLAAIAPDVVVNCAAFHRVDECEARPEEALRVNALGARNVALACARLGALAVYISTDYVFGGEAVRTWSRTPRPPSTCTAPPRSPAST